MLKFHLALGPSPSVSPEKAHLFSSIIIHMSTLISQISGWALGVIDKTGYAGVFILSMLESAAIPIPSEIVVPFSGFLASSGRFGLLAVVLVATAANLTGSVILFLIGRSGGRWILERYGKYVFIHQKDLDLGDRWFLKHGVKAVFFGRMLPVVRTFISLPAGVAKMNFKKFAAYTFLGALPWNFALAYIGFKMGENWEVLHPYFQKLNYAIAGLIGVGILWYIFKHQKAKAAGI